MVDFKFLEHFGKWNMRAKKFFLLFNFNRLIKTQDAGKSNYKTWQKCKVDEKVDDECNTM